MSASSPSSFAEFVALFEDALPVLKVIAPIIDALYPPAAVPLEVAETLADDAGKGLASLKL